MLEIHLTEHSRFHLYLHFDLRCYFFRFSRTKILFVLSILKQFLNSMSLYFALETVENNKNMKSLKFQRDMFNIWDFIQVFVYTTNHTTLSRTDNDKNDTCVRLLQNSTIKVSPHLSAE